MEETKRNPSQEKNSYKITVDPYCNLIVELKDEYGKFRSPQSGEKLSEISEEKGSRISGEEMSYSSEEESSKIDGEKMSRDSEENMSKTSVEHSSKNPNESTNGFSFASLVKKKSNGTNQLSLNGRLIFLVRGKRLDDSDIPDLLNFLREYPEIDDLDLSFNEIHCDGFIDLIDYISLNNKIVNLNVQHNEIRSKGINYLYESRDRLQLRILILTGNKIGVESSKQLALMLQNNEYLRELGVANVDQMMSSLVYFIAVLRQDQDSGISNLKKLDISSPNPPCSYFFDTAHFSSLIGSMLKNNTYLEDLHLQKYGFSCHDIVAMLEEGKYNRTLILLDLTGNNIGDHGVESIANWLAQRPALSNLILARNIVTTIGASFLSRGLTLSRIKDLDISYNRIDDFGISEILNSIKKRPLLNGLKLFGNCIGHESSKIINRMLLSKVLTREHLDVRPYRVNHIWSCALHLVD